MLAENLTGRAMRGLIAIERDLMRQSPLAPESPSEEHLGRGDVSLGAKQNIDGLSLFVDGTIEIGPATLDFDVGFVDAPGLAHRASKAVPALFEFRRIALDPPHDRRVRQRKPALGHHLHEITKAEFVPQIPAHAEHDDLPVEMAAFEKIINVQHAWPGSSRTNLPPNMRHTHASHQNPMTSTVHRGVDARLRRPWRSGCKEANMAGSFPNGCVIDKTPGLTIYSR